MTIDKIKFYMDSIIFEHWINCKDINAINNAYNLLKSEIECKLLNDIKYFSELNLLTILKN